MTSPESAESTPQEESALEPPPKLRTVSKNLVAVAARDHPTLLLTLVYLALTFVGMIHDLWFYFYFRINILDFSETSDFLLAAIRNPLVIVLSILPIAILLGFQKMRETAIKKSEWYGKHHRKYLHTRWNSVFFRLFIYGWFVVVYAIVFTQLYAQREASRIKKGNGRRVSYIRNDGIRTDDNPILLGTTAKFLFFYSPTTKTTEIVPIEATTALRVDSRRRREREQDSLLFPDSLAIPDSGQ
jgi:hypothetical protein